MNFKNSIVALITVFIFSLMAYLASTGTTFQGGEQSRIIEDIGTDAPTAEKIHVADKENEKLQDLKDKAGSGKTFHVSIAYKRKCSSCHGVNGRGIIGPDLFGKSAQEIYEKLLDYKSGRVENPIMRGLIMNITKKELKILSDEIGNFKNKKQ